MNTTLPALTEGQIRVQRESAAKWWAAENGAPARMIGTEAVAYVEEYREGGMEGLVERFVSYLTGIPTAADLHEEIITIFEAKGAIRFCPARYALASCYHREGHEGKHHTIGLTGAVRAF